MSTDLLSDADADAEPTFEPRDGEHGESEAQSTDESEPTTDDHDAWKIHCRECSELVPAKPYCYECGAERPADGDFTSLRRSEGGERDTKRLSRVYP